jgi:hypothetical protein
MSLTLNCPLNPVSFGQVSVALLREAYKREEDVLVALIGDKPDLGSQKTDAKFIKWLEGALKGFSLNQNRDTPTLRLWHLNGSLNWVSDNQALMSFYELDSPTKTEINIAKNQHKLMFSSEYSCEVFKNKGVDCHYVPLGFDAANFEVLNKKYHNDDRIVFNLAGKFEFRKHHAKILDAWSRKYGNNKKYVLQSAIFNPFMDGQKNNNLIANSLSHKKYFNMSFLPQMETNAMYNDYLNSSDIMIGMSGGEGWGLPEFQSVALGKHAVILNAHGYKNWASEENAVLVNPSGKVKCVDGLFFLEGGEYNQGNIFDWDEDDFIDGCEEAIKRVESNKVNSAGLKLQEDFAYSKTLDAVLKVLHG